MPWEDSSSSSRCTACASGEIIERDSWAEPEPEACAQFLCEFGLDFFLLGRAFEVPFFRRRGFIIKLHEIVNKVGIGRNPNLGLYFSLFTRNAAYLIIFAKGCKSPGGSRGTVSFGECANPRECKCFAISLVPDFRFIRSLNLHAGAFLESLVTFVRAGVGLSHVTIAHIN